MVTRRELLTASGAFAIFGLPVGVLAQSEDAAVAHIKSFYDGLQAAMEGPQAADPKQRIGALSEVMMRTFDIAAMTRLAVGPQWSKIPAPQQASLQEAFGRFFIATYASQLGKASGGKFEVLPKVEQRTGGQLVHTRVTDAQGKATPVNYLVGKEGRVVDIYLGGTVSMVAARRPEFEAALKAGGPEALEANLRKRADGLMGGT
jgi:phospholipid transport system substrate-binding protein